MGPLFQSSANRSGEPAPAHFADVPREILTEVDVAIDGGALTGLPSTVVDLTSFDRGGEWSVLREGGLGAAELGERLHGL
jgi:tRNA A37 threonylcarbamoyladenosine synthetase subunit TsaC/SUA5/YrdC